MRSKRLFGILLILLIMLLTACGGNPNKDLPLSTPATPGQVTDSQTEIQSAEPVRTEHTPATDAASTVPELTDPVPTTEEPIPDESDADLPAYGDYYYDLVNVVLYLELYDELPPNYITKNEARALGWEGGSVENYRDGAAIGGDYFGNYEGLLPKANGRSYTECDIDTKGYKSRGSRRLIFSNDGLYFYTSDHYESFSEVTVTEDYEVIW